MSWSEVPPSICSQRKRPPPRRRGGRGGGPFFVAVGGGRRGCVGERGPAVHLLPEKALALAQQDVAVGGLVLEDVGAAPVDALRELGQLPRRGPHTLRA